MKKLFLLLSALILASCTPKIVLQTIEPSETLYSIDFTPFSKKGFLITPEKYNGQYESLGLVKYEAFPGGDYMKVGNKSGRLTSQSDRISEWQKDPYSLQNVLPRVYDICVKLGADALVNFDYELIKRDVADIPNHSTLTGVRITGFAIKRLDK
jgi:hypothetical protein